MPADVCAHKPTNLQCTRPTCIGKETCLQHVLVTFQPGDGVKRVCKGSFVNPLPASHSEPTQSRTELAKLLMQFFQPEHLRLLCCFVGTRLPAQPVRFTLYQTRTCPWSAGVSLLVQKRQNDRLTQDSGIIITHTFPGFLRLFFLLMAISGYHADMSEKRQTISECFDTSRMVSGRCVCQSCTA